MVDTTFLLLLFFMITAAFSLQRSLPVPTPRPETPSATVVQRDPSEDADAITVHVDENNTFRVVTADVDVEAPSSHELLIRLREACEGNRAGASRRNCWLWPMSRRCMTVWWRPWMRGVKWGWKKSN